MRELVILLCFPLQQAIANVLVPSVVHNKEHKVHNIVLYPDKHSWCKTTPIKQVITHPGCKAVEVENNVCVGGCFSYSIPKTEPQTPGEVAPYCDSCQPAVVKWKHVTLECTDSDYEEDNVMTKRVEMIDSCACASCYHGGANSIPQTDATRDAPSMDVPELMSLMMKTHTRTESKDVSVTSTSAYMDTQRSRFAMVEQKTVENKENPEKVLELEAFHDISSKNDQKIQKLETYFDIAKADQPLKVHSENLKSVFSGLEHDHSRHHRVPGPHHSMVYPVYSADIASEIYERMKPKSGAPESDPTKHPMDVESSHHKPAKDQQVQYHVENLIFSPLEEKLALKKKFESHSEEKR